MVTAALVLALAASAMAAPAPSHAHAERNLDPRLGPVHVGINTVHHEERTAHHITRDLARVKARYGHMINMPLGGSLDLNLDLDSNLVKRQSASVVVSATAPARSTSSASGEPQIVGQAGALNATGSSNVSASTTESLTNLNRDVYYTIPVTLGTPGTTVDVTFDTGSSDLWFNSRNVSMSASSTYKSTNETLELQYAIGYATGTYATDTVAVAGQVIDDFKFGVVTRTSDFSAPMAGLLGMSWPMTNTTSGKNYTDPFWHAAVGGWQDKQFGVYLARNEKTTDQNVAKPITPGGQVTLGGVNTDLFDGDLTYIDLVNATRPAYWAVPLDAITMTGGGGSSTANSVNPGNASAIIDSGTSVILGGTTVVSQIYRSLKNAQRTGSGSSYWAAPCDSFNKWSVGFTFRSQTYNITGDDLMYAAHPYTKGYCLGAILSADGYDEWLMGAPFMKNVYTAHRYDPPSVGFAPLAAGAAKAINAGADAVSAASPRVPAASAALGAVAVAAIIAAVI